MGFEMTWSCCLVILSAYRSIYLKVEDYEPQKQNNIDIEYWARKNDISLNFNFFLLPSPTAENWESCLSSAATFIFEKWCSGPPHNIYIHTFLYYVRGLKCAVLIVEYRVFWTLLNEWFIYLCLKPDWFIYLCLKPDWFIYLCLQNTHSVQDVGCLSGYRWRNVFQIQWWCGCNIWNCKGQCHQNCGVWMNFRKLFAVMSVLLCKLTKTVDGLRVVTIWNKMRPVESTNKSVD